MALTRLLPVLNVARGSSDTIERLLEKGQVFENGFSKHEKSENDIFSCTFEAT
jgi:hypothetical protein